METQLQYLAAILILVLGVPETCLISITRMRKTNKLLINALLPILYFPSGNFN